MKKSLLFRQKVVPLQAVYQRRTVKAVPWLCVDSISCYDGNAVRETQKTQRQCRWAQYVSRTETSSWQRTHIINY